MQTTQATQEDIARWKRDFRIYRSRLRPNRISGAALYAYLESRYPLLPLEDGRLERVVCENILQNECFACELPPGRRPDPVCCAVEPVGAGMELYRTQDALFSGCDIVAGIDLVTGYFLVEGSSALWDDLFAQRGLNERELENVYCVSEYISCLRRFGLLEQTLLP